MRVKTIIAALVVLISVFSMAAPAAAGARARAWTPIISPIFTEQEERLFRGVDTDLRNRLISMCPSRRLCVAAGEGNGLHSVFYLYYCTERSLTNFLGAGSAKNNQTDGATARFLNQNRVIKVSLTPDPDPVRIEWDPIYYLDPC